MSREIFDGLERERDICALIIIPSQNTAFVLTQALKVPGCGRVTFSVRMVYQRVSGYVVGAWGGAFTF